MEHQVKSLLTSDTWNKLFFFFFTLKMTRWSNHLQPGSSKGNKDIRSNILYPGEWMINVIGIDKHLYTLDISLRKTISVSFTRKMILRSWTSLRLTHTVTVSSYFRQTSTGKLTLKVNQLHTLNEGWWNEIKWDGPRTHCQTTNWLRLGLSFAIIAAHQQSELTTMQRDGIGRGFMHFDNWGGGSSTG